MDNDSYLLLLLSDGNLPTGSFVSSSGLESYFKHGFPALAQETILDPGTPKAPVGIQSTIAFIRQSLAAYTRLALPFASDAHVVTAETEGSTEQSVLHQLHELDARYEAMTLNHITRRASKAQGVALLTLFSKGFSRPGWVDGLTVEGSIDKSLGPRSQNQRVFESLVDAFKLSIRRGETPGHLPVCWGVLTASLLLSKERSQQLFLFLFARSLLSAAIRLNTIGPYAAQQLLLHVIRPMVDEEAANCGSLSAQMPPSQKQKPARRSKYASAPLHQDGEEDWDRLENEGLPATTWPLGEILAARHDLQHSRIFNS